MKRRWVVMLLILLAAGLLFRSRSSQPALTEAVLTWDGQALTGQKYYERVLEHVTIHYTKPTRADVVEKFGQELLLQIDQHESMWGPLLPGERLHLWVVPRYQKLPLGLNPQLSPMQAVGPWTVVVTGSVLPEPDQIARFAGLDEVLAVAMTQPEGSPAYSVAWLHNGTGRAMSVPYRDFPGGLYNASYWPSRYLKGLEQLKVDEVVNTMSGNRGGPRTDARTASGAIVGLLMDRWGPNWWEYYPGNPSELTYVEAIRWATGASDDDEALARFEVRMREALRGHNAAKDEANLSRPMALVDQGQNRLAPPREVRPVPGNNRSRHTYQFDVQWDAATHAAAGDEVLTWENGEGVPIDRLHFTLWGNSTSALWYGGFTKVESVAVDGQTVAYQTRGLDLVVPLGRQVQPGERVEVSIRFQTRLPGIRPWLPPRMQNDSADKFALSLWYPALAPLDEEGWHLDSFPANGKMAAEPADYEVTLTVPAGTQVEAPGQTPAVTDEGAQHVYRFSGRNLPEWSAVLIGQNTTE